MGGWKWHGHPWNEWQWLESKTIHFFLQFTSQLLSDGEGVAF
jgi:hypothetical protein